MAKASPSQLQQLLEHFVGERCRRVFAGGVGSTFYLYFGEDIPIRLGKYALLPKEQCYLTAENGIEANYSAWRLGQIREERVLATSYDDNSSQGPIPAAIGKLTNTTVTSVELRRPWLDCSFIFDDIFQLDLFAVGGASCTDNYVIWRGSQSMAVGPYSCVEIEQVVRGLTDEGQQV